MVRRSKRDKNQKKKKSRRTEEKVADVATAKEGSRGEYRGKMTAEINYKTSSAYSWPAKKSVRYAANRVDRRRYFLNISRTKTVFSFYSQFTLLHGVYNGSVHYIVTATERT